MLHTFEFGNLLIPANVAGKPAQNPNGYVVPAGPLALLHPFGDTEFPMPIDQLFYQHPTPDDRPNLADGR